MDLHQAHQVADWQLIPPAKRNPWQRLAAKTSGLATPANAVTAAGLALVGWSVAEIVQHNFASGLVLLCIGRLADVVDGWAAARTGTKSPLGEIFDAGADKLAAGGIVLAMVLRHILPLWAGGIIALQVLFTLWVVDAARRRSVRLHPSRLGKISAGGEWAALALLVLCKGLAENGGAHNLATAGNAVAAIALAISLFGAWYASAEYARTTVWRRAP